MSAWAGLSNEAATCLSKTAAGVVEGVLAEPEAAGAEVCVLQARAATLLLTP